MAIGTTSTFSQTRDEIIADALTNVGALAPGGTPSGQQVTHAKRVLGALVKSIDADGENTWKTIRRTGTTTVSVAYITPATDVIDVDEPLNYLRSGQTSRSPIRVISRDDFMLIPDRTTTGVPQFAFVEKTLASSGQEQLTLTFWPVPDATGDTVEYAAILRRYDYIDGSTHSDFPTKWIRCLKLGLSSELAFAYGFPALGAQFADMYEAEKAKQTNADNERGNMILVPFGGSY